MPVVASPDGRRWTVRRRWLPRHASLARRWIDRRRRRRPSDERVRWWDVLDVPFDVGDVFFGIALVVALVLLVLWGLPALLALVDLLLLLVLFVGGVVARVLLRRPWTVEATADDGERRERQVVGWRRAGVAADTWADELGHGRG